VTAAAPRLTYTGEPVTSSSSSSTSLLLQPPSHCTLSSVPPSLFAPSVSRTQTTVPTPFELFQPYVVTRSLPVPPPPPVPCQSGFTVVGRLATTAAAGNTLLPGRLGPDMSTAAPASIHPTYLPPLGTAGPAAAAAAAAAAAIWTKHWQKTHESSTTTLIHPFAAAPALW